MRVLICIDDTDNLESKGTGKLASELMADIESRGWGKCSVITRHQLFVHPDVPYTSHNSSMCFAAELEEQSINTVINFAGDFLKRNGAPGSDPGLCVADLACLTDISSLLEFGLKAKVAVLTKKEAYDLAERLGIHLSEHGGTGQGVIGALAGVGLRLSGNDGRCRGKLYLEINEPIVPVQEIKNQTYIDAVRSIDGTLLRDEELVRVGEFLKPVLLEGQFVLLVNRTGKSEDVNWEACPKEQIKAFSDQVKTPMPNGRA